MTYSPDPDRRPIPRIVIAVWVALIAATVALFFAPVIIRTIWNA